PGRPGGQGRVVEAVAGQSHGASSVAECTRLYGKRQGGQGAGRGRSPPPTAPPEPGCSAACEVVGAEPWACPLKRATTLAGGSTCSVARALLDRPACARGSAGSGSSRLRR